jgi:hypothetical protein
MRTISLTIGALLAFASCRKDRVCTCGIETPNGVIVETTTMYKVTKREAHTNCFGQQTVTQTATSTTYSNKKTCKLK